MQLKTQLRNPSLIHSKTINRKTNKTLNQLTRFSKWRIQKSQKNREPKPHLGGPVWKALDLCQNEIAQAQLTLSLGFVRSLFTPRSHGEYSSPLQNSLFVECSQSIHAIQNPRQQPSNPIPPIRRRRNAGPHNHRRSKSKLWHRNPILDRDRLNLRAQHSNSRERETGRQKEKDRDRTGMGASCVICEGRRGLES